jgi:hypothetical protein
MKTVPLWHMNGTMTRDGIAAQLKASRDVSGFAGVAVLPVKHTEPRYLTEDYFARYGDILETSKELGMSVVFYDDIGVLYPVATMQAYARFDKVDGPHPGLTMPANTDFNELSDLLTGGIRRDFTFLHPEILDEKCRVAGATLRLENRVNFEDYRVIILPSVSAIHWSNLQKVKAFYDAGGKVIATTQLPSLLAEFGHDGDVRQAIAAVFSSSVNDQDYARKTNAAGGASYFVPSLKENGLALTAALADAVPVADVRFGDSAPRFEHLPQSGSRPPKEGKHVGMLSYIHKVKDGRDVYFLANSTDKGVDMDLVLRGRLRLQSWNPDDGCIADVESVEVVENGSPCTRVRLKLGAVRSTFLVSDNQRKDGYE